MEGPRSTWQGASLPVLLASQPTTPLGSQSGMYTQSEGDDEESLTAWGRQKGSKWLHDSLRCGYISTSIAHVTNCQFACCTSACLLMCMLHLTGAPADAHPDLAKLTLFGEAEGSSEHLSTCYLLGHDSQGTITACNELLQLLPEGTKGVHRWNYHEHYLTG